MSDAEVTAAAERPPSALAWARALTDTQITQEQLDELVRIRLSEPSALRAANLRERDEALAVVERVRAVRDDLYLAALAQGMPGGVRKLIDRLDAALDPDPADRGTGRDGGGSP